MLASEAHSLLGEANKYLEETARILRSQGYRAPLVRAGLFYHLHKWIMAQPPGFSPPPPWARARDIFWQVASAHTAIARAVARWAVRKFRAEYVEAYGTCIEQLFRAATQWRTEGQAFYWFARRALRQRMINDCLRDKMRDATELSMDNVSRIDSSVVADDASTSMDLAWRNSAVLAQDQSDTVIDLHKKRLVRKIYEYAAKKGPGVQRIFECLSQGLTPTETAEELDISRQYVYKVLNEARIALT